MYRFGRDAIRLLSRRLAPCLQAGHHSVSPTMRAPAMSIAVITDSTACIPPGVAVRHRIEVVPLHIIFQGRTFTDSLTRDTRDFYDLLRTSHERPTTAAPSPQMFLDAIGRAGVGADAILCVTVSKQFSAMYDSARLAIGLATAESPDLEIRLFDSGNAAMAQGFVVLEAARVARTGAGMDDVIARATEISRRAELLAVIDTLTYLARGGRVPRVAAWAAGMLQVKPIVRFDASGIRLISRTRTRRRAIDRMLSELARAADGEMLHIAVHHAHAPADAEYLRAQIEARFRIAEIYVTEFTQAMGVHTGPGLLALSFWRE